MVRKSVFIFGLLDEGFSTLELIFREWREVVIKGKKKRRKDAHRECYMLRHRKTEDQPDPLRNVPSVSIPPFDLRNSTSFNIHHTIITVFSICTKKKKYLHRKHTGFEQL